jgi:murein DD-endopeptidase MepM/ murein hydrolase activator NlpD
MKPNLILPTSGSPIQLFGANPQFYADPKYGGIKGHNGIDFLTNHGWTIYASHDGVAEYQIDSSGGHGVVITSKDEYYYDDVKKEIISRTEAYLRGYRD